MAAIAADIPVTNAEPVEVKPNETQTPTDQAAPQNTDSNNVPITTTQTPIPPQVVPKDDPLIKKIKKGMDILKTINLCYFYHFVF